MNDTLHAAAGLDLPLARDGVEGEGDMQERIRARTRVLAVKAGRVPPHVLQVDYEQAKREQAGEVEVDAEGEGDGGKGCPEGGECGRKIF